MTDHPIGEVDKLLGPKLDVNGTLDTGDHVENHAGIEPADRHINHRGYFPSPEGHKEVDEDGDHHNFNGHSRYHRSKLGKHGDGAVDEVMHSLQRVEEGQSPEAQQRDGVTPDGFFQDGGDKVVHHAPTQRCDQQTDQVVDIEANKENLVISCWSNQVIEIITENGTIRQEIPVTSKIGMLDEGNKSAMAGYLTLHQGNVFYSSPALGLFKFPLSLVKGGALKWTKLMGVLICPYSAIR